MQLSLPTFTTTALPSPMEPQVTTEVAGQDSGRQSVDPSRTLAHRFMRLPYVERIRVANELGLLTEDDANESDIEKFRRVFRRAKEQGRLSEMWSLVETVHDDGMYSTNPFEDRE